MKLITKTSYYYLLISVVLLMSAGAVFYFYLSKLLNEEINEQIEIDKQNIKEYVSRNEIIPPLSPLVESIVSYVPNAGYFQEMTRDTHLLSPLKDEYLPYRQVIFAVKIKEQNYKVILSKPLFEKDDLLETIAKTMGIFILLFGFLLFLLSRWSSSILWKPFYQTLNELKKIGFQENTTLQLSSTTTDEFAQLNMQLLKMTERLQRQFQNLKEFSENASHEIQTPLGIIRNKLELLMQTPKHTDEEAGFIREAFESANRLSKLTKSLLLLSKIENRQFHEVQKINLKGLIEGKIELFDDIKQIKNLTIETNFNDPALPEMNPHLADILLSNLLGNAFKHTEQDGVIKIQCNGQSLCIQNSGKPLSQPEINMFNRFAKGPSAASDSPGLGLAIVKEICTIYQFAIIYQYEDGWHKITIRF